MIKIKTKYDFTNDILKVKQYKYAHTCTYEHLALIDLLIKEILRTQSDIYKTKKDVLKALEKDIIKERVERQ